MTTGSADTPAGRSGAPPRANGEMLERRPSLPSPTIRTTSFFRGSQPCSRNPLLISPGILCARASEPPRVVDPALTRADRPRSMPSGRCGHTVTLRGVGQTAKSVGGLRCAVAGPRIENDSNKHAPRLARMTPRMPDRVPAAQARDVDGFEKRGQGSLPRVTSTAAAIQYLRSTQRPCRWNSVADLFECAAARSCKPDAVRKGLHPGGFPYC